MTLKLKMFSNILVRIKKCLILVIIQFGQNNTMIQQLVVVKMKDET